MHNIISYLYGRLRDSQSPLFFSDGAIVFVLSLALPPLLTWLSVVVWFRRREERRFTAIRRVIAEELQGQVKDLVFGGLRLISAVRAGNAQRAQDAVSALDAAYLRLRTFLFERLRDFSTERIGHIGNILQTAVVVKAIAKAAEDVERGHPVAVVVHHPLLTVITSGARFRMLARNEPGLALDNGDQVDTAYHAAGDALVDEVGKLTADYTRRTWWLDVTRMGLEETSRRSENVANSPRLKPGR